MAAAGTRLLQFVFTFTLAFSICELLAGLATRSLLLMEESVHMFADSVSFGISLWAESRVEATNSQRANLIGAGVSLATLTFTMAAVFIGSLQRLAHLHDHGVVVDSNTMLGFGVVLSCFHLLCLFLYFRGYSVHAGHGHSHDHGHSHAHAHAHGHDDDDDEHRHHHSHHSRHHDGLCASLDDERTCDHDEPRLAGHARQQCEPCVAHSAAASPSACCAPKGGADPSATSHEHGHSHSRGHGESHGHNHSHHAHGKSHGHNHSSHDSHGHGHGHAQRENQQPHNGSHGHSHAFGESHGHSHAHSGSHAHSSSNCSHNGTNAHCDAMHDHDATAGRGDVALGQHGPDDGLELTLRSQGGGAPVAYHSTPGAMDGHSDLDLQDITLDDLEEHAQCGDGARGALRTHAHGHGHGHKQMCSGSYNQVGCDELGAVDGEDLSCEAHGHSHSCCGIDHKSLNMASAVFHILIDFLHSFFVVVTALILRSLGPDSQASGTIDAAASLALSFVIGGGVFLLGRSFIAQLRAHCSRGYDDLATPIGEEPHLAGPRADLSAIAPS